MAYYLWYLNGFWKTWFCNYQFIIFKELGELRIILKILFYATSLNLSPEYNRCFEEILSLSIDPDIL